MNKRITDFDCVCIERCIELSIESAKNNRAPFGALVSKNNKVLVEAGNKPNNWNFEHAEVIVLHKAQEKLSTEDLSDCTLYSNCEPCPMCSFMIREYKISKVVFAVWSPIFGGYSKWKILQDEELSQFKNSFNLPPEVVGGVLEEKAKKVFEKNNLWMFGKDAKENKKYVPLK